MKAITTSIRDVYILEPMVFPDNRGFFMESYNKHKFKGQTGIDVDFVQDNHSRSSYGVLRGLHFQKPPMAQAKLVRVTRGEVLDVIVDIRKNSPTFGQVEKVRLSEENQRMVYMPKGVAHGFLVLAEDIEFLYKVDQYYSPEHESGIRFDDPDLNIDWEIPENDLILSEKDKILPTFASCKEIFE